MIGDERVFWLSEAGTVATEVSASVETISGVARQALSACQLNDGGQQATVEGMDSEQVAMAVSNVPTLGSVAIIGAGFSAARYPMTAQLTMLRWHALDEVPSGRARLAEQLDVDDGPAKTLIDHDAQAVEAVWEIVRTDDEVRRAFQTEFVRLDAEKEPTPAHSALARVIRAGHVQYIVSFNWDSALERA